MSDYSSGGALALGIGGAMTFFYLLLIIAICVANWKVFEKAGKPGWAALIPFYNTWVLCEMLWPNGHILPFILLFVPLVQIVYVIMLVFRLAKAFGKDMLFGFGLLFLCPIFLLILGFGDSTYQPEALS